MIVIRFSTESPEATAADVLREFVLLVGAEKWGSWWEWLFEYKRLSEAVISNSDEIYYYVDGEEISTIPSPGPCLKYRIRFDYDHRQATIEKCN